jgi:hypothetical protein
MLSAMKLAVLKMTTVIIAPIGCSVRVETNRPDRAERGEADGEVERGGRDPQQALAEADLVAGQQGHVSATEEGEPHPIPVTVTVSVATREKITMARYLTARSRARCTGTASR